MKRLGLNKDEKKHKYLGDVSKYFTVELVRDGFLEYEAISGTDPVQHKFIWGTRSKLEITKASVLDFASKIYGGCDPKSWSTQYKEAHQGAEAREEIV